MRRFHLASISGDVRTLNQVTDFEGGPAFALELQRRVRDIARIGGRYELRRVQRDRSTAVAQVVYRLPYRNQEIPSLWVVERGPGRWRVNPYRTIRLMERAFGVHP